MAENRIDKASAARALSALGAAKGGAARAKRLTSQQRSQIARAAALARHGKDLPLATHGSPDSPLKIGNIEITAYVLSDDRRVLAQRGLQTGVGFSRSGGKLGARRIAQFLTSLQKKGMEIGDLIARVNNPIRFIPPHGGNPADGYEATILPDICDVVLDARNSGMLLPSQDHIATQCEILVRGFARVGIIALVDEATGFQADRARDALARILEQFIAKELRRWVRTFPPEFYEEMFRLHGWNYPATSSARPQVVGHYTNDVIYRRLAPGVLGKLHELTPRRESGRLKTHLHRRLTEDVGHPKLREHLASVVTIMKLSTDWTDFMTKLDRVHPRWGDPLPLPFPEALPTPTAT